ncbi:MAG: hypothetical protein ACRECC_08460 [Pseudolabrys sp.]|jgi:hypothetical protein
MKWLALAATLLMAGCSTDIEPTQEQLKAMWEAQNVYPEHSKSDLLSFMRTYLNDPVNVRSAQVSQPFRKKVGFGERFITCVSYNSRNTDGKYMGVKEGVAVYTNGKLASFIDVTHEVKELCKDVALAPFPELEKLQRFHP